MDEQGDRVEAGGPTAASEALAGGRPAIARSFRLHRPRGPFCGTGWCQQCPVRTLDGSTDLACIVPAVAASRSRTDVLRPLGRLAESMPPWFYERRFVRPRAIRQPALRMLRRLSAAPPLPHSGRRLGSARELRTEVLVIGAGPAGLAAAATAARTGRSVAVLDRGPLGGAARWLPRLRPAASSALEEIRARRAEVLAGTPCLSVDPAASLATAVGPEGPVEIAFRHLVVATGAYDRPLLYRGNDLPGTIGIRGFEAMASGHGFRPGTRVGVVARPEEAERFIQSAKEHGVVPAWVAGPADVPDSEMSLPRTGLSAAAGKRRLRSVELIGVGSLATDVLVLGFSQPSFELAGVAGAEVTVAGEPPVLRCSGGRALIVGEAAGWVDPERGAEAAVEAMLAHLDGAPGERTEDPSWPGATPPPSVPHPEAFVCWCEDVRLRDLSMAVADGFGHIELLKRRTGAITGPCQGKLCLGPMLEAVRALDLPAAPPTLRPPAVPVPLAALSDHG